MDPPKESDQGKSSNRSAFNKMCASLVKKAGELSVLCGSEVAVFGFGNDGKLFEYASNADMPKILERFEKAKRLKQGISVNNDPEGEEDVLKEEMEKLKQSRDKHVLGRDLDSISGKDLQEFEQQLNEGLLCIKDRKDAILKQQLQQSKGHKGRCMEENETLRRKVEELEKLGVLSRTYQQPSFFFENQLMMLSRFADGQGVYGHQMACNTSTGDANSVDVTLQLGPTTYNKVSAKRKTPEQGSNQDEDQDTFLTL